MNSFNHYSFGAVGAWMSHSLGIERNQDKPGFKHFILQPRKAVYELESVVMNFVRL